MRAMVLNRLRTPLVLTERADPQPGPGEIRVRVAACAVCRTDLHVVDGDLPDPRLPIIPGHEIVGRVDALGPAVAGLDLGERVGIPWVGHTCGACPACLEGRENLCDHPVFTGYTRDGGFATAAVADARYAFPWGGRGRRGPGAPPLRRPDRLAFPRLRRDGQAPGTLRVRRLGPHRGPGGGLAGARGLRLHPPRDTATQAFARGLGAVWAGDSDQPPPEQLDAAIIFAAVGALVPLALAAVRKGGRVVCAGIHMTDLPSFPYRLLWEERQVLSVANLTRKDGLEFLALAPRVGLRTQTTRYALAQANEALADLRAGRFEGAAVLVP